MTAALGDKSAQTAAGTGTSLAGLAGSIAAIATGSSPIGWVALGFGLLFLVIFILLAGIVMVIAAVTLKAPAADLSAVSEFLSQLDLEFLQTLQAVETDYASTYDSFTYFENGTEKLVTDFTLSSDLATYVMYLDYKFGDYHFSDVKDEVTWLHGQLNQLTITPDPAAATHALVSVQFLTAQDYLILPGAPGYDPALAQAIEAMQEVGPFTGTTVLANPFATALGETPWSVSSYFGHRFHPITGVPEFHSGLDIPLTEGTPVQAVAPGKVELSAPFTGYGTYVKTTHNQGDEKIEIIYAHLSEKYVFAPFDTVQTGDIIGTVGHTGDATGDHLHLEYHHNDIRLNPLFFLAGGPKNPTPSP